MIFNKYLYTSINRIFNKFKWTLFLSSYDNLMDLLVECMFFLTGTLELKFFKLVPFFFGFKFDYGKNRKRQKILYNWNLKLKYKIHNFILFLYKNNGAKIDVTFNYLFIQVYRFFLVIHLLKILFSSIMIE